jgi:hypothetical protein
VPSSAVSSLNRVSVKGEFRANAIFSFKPPPVDSGCPGHKRKLMGVGFTEPPLQVFSATRVLSPSSEIQHRAAVQFVCGDLVRDHFFDSVYAARLFLSAY